MPGCAHSRRTRFQPQLRAATLLACTASLGMGVNTVNAQSHNSTAVERASYERAVGREPVSSVRFARRAPQVGDQTEQSVEVALRLNTIVRQGNEVLEQAKTVIRRRQGRVVTTSEIAAGQTVAATVRYAEAKKQIMAGQAAGELPEEPATPQPVEGKTYRCRRDGETLAITDSAGNIPPLDEFEIVAQNMDSLGRPNALAEFLAERTLAVGQTIDLPNEVAEKLLGLGDTLGEVTRFRLRLDDVRSVDGCECAVFHATIDAGSHDSSQMRLQMEGRLVIQTATSRAVQAALVGPIGMSETRGSLDATYQMTGAGRMSVNIASAYHDLAR